VPPLDTALAAARARRRALRQRLRPRAVITVVMVVGSVLLVLSQLAPRHVISGTTPTGGDTGAHVWVGDFLKHHLLSHGRLTGWAPSWYAGFPLFVFYFVPPFLAMVGLSLVMPYVIAFKLVTVAGLLALPVVAYAFGRLAGLAWPRPPLLAAATLPFLFDQSYTILGGNIASTLAGEFAFSISLALSLLFLGVLIRGSDTGRHRPWAAGLLGLAILCHVYAAILAVVGGALFVISRRSWRAVRWAAPVFVVGGALTGFWLLPFVLRLGYTTDMGWEKDTNYKEMLFPFLVHPADGSGTPVFIGVLALAAVAVLGGLLRRRRVPLLLTAIAACSVVAFVVMPQNRLYNSRLLPVWFLCVHLLAGLGLAELVSGARLARRRRLALTSTIGAFGVVLLSVAVPLALVPGWLPLPELHHGRPRLVKASRVEKSFVPDWAAENYKGYEAADAWPEYHRLMETMGRLPCGRAMAEFSESLERYGTSTALMLMPYWTHGCIDAMEGMYYESASTTPYHFLAEAELSRTPSSPMRDLPYRGLDVAHGVQQLRLLGVRYYMSFSKAVYRQASRDPQLRLVATSKPWSIWEIEDSKVVEPLHYLPTVLTNVPKDGIGWLDASVAAYTADPSSFEIPFAVSGPRNWPRAEATWSKVDKDASRGADISLPEPARLTVDPATVSHVELGDDRVSFDVDRLGTPVLVKVSYFPNWQVRGADGPWRVTPNLMVVVPTAHHVSLHYGVTPVDKAGWLLTVLGVVGLLVLIVLPRWRREQMTYWTSTKSRVSRIEAIRH